MTATHSHSVERGSLVELFRKRSEPLGVSVSYSPDRRSLLAAIQGAAVELEVANAIISKELAKVADWLPVALDAFGITAAIVSDETTARDHPFGIALAAAGIAESGSALMAEADLADRMVAMATLAALIVIPADTLLPDLDAAVPLLKQISQRPGGGHAAFITGPSRTADIEMSLTVGVQGPAKVFIAITDALSGNPVQ